MTLRKWRLVALVLWLALSGCTTMKMKTGSLEIGQRFQIIGGDGDPDFFSKPRNIRLTEADWFPGRVRRGEALLFIVEDDEYRGEYIALTPRGPAHLGEVLAAYKLASVVVHRIKNPTATFNGDEEDAFPIGMGAAKRL